MRMPRDKHRDRKGVEKSKAQTTKIVMKWNTFTLIERAEQVIRIRILVWVYCGNSGWNEPGRKNTMPLNCKAH